MTPKDGALAEIQLGEYHYRVFPPVTGKVRLDKGRSHDSMATFMLEWRADSGFLEMFEPPVVHDAVVLILLGKWSLQAEEELSRSCEQKYMVRPAWCVTDYGDETLIDRRRRAPGG